jgi:hypothetical protein
MLRRDPTRVLSVARALLVANGLLWLGLAAMTLRGQWAANVAGTPAPTLLVVLMVGNAAVLLGLSRGLRPEHTASLVTAAAWVTVNLILSVTDQLGVMDVAVAILNAATLTAIAGLRRRSVS